MTEDSALGQAENNATLAAQNYDFNYCNKQPSSNDILDVFTKDLKTIVPFF